MRTKQNKTNFLTVPAGRGALLICVVGSLCWSSCGVSSVDVPETVPNGGDETSLEDTSTERPLGDGDAVDVRNESRTETVPNGGDETSLEDTSTERPLGDGDAIDVGNESHTSCEDSADYATETGFQSFALGQTIAGIVELSFSVRTSANPVDGLVGLSHTAASKFNDLPVILRLAPSGRIDSRDGDTYAADTEIPYIPGDWLHVQIVIDYDAQTYDVRVSPCGEALTPLLMGARFRTDAIQTSDSSMLVLYSDGRGVIELNNLKILTLRDPPVCVAQTCAELNATCGRPSDGCGGTLYCGNCETAHTCTAYYSCAETTFDEYRTTKTLSQFGVTWTFDSDVRFGEYANGDYWVLGPVTLTHISPASESGKHGSMVNPAPGSRQGFDSRIKHNTYDETLNVASSLPLRLTGNQSLVSSVSHDEGPIRDQPLIETYAVLTVVDEVPPVGSFRPPAVGDDKRGEFNSTMLDYSPLRRLEVVDHTPNIHDVARKLRRFRNEMNTVWTGRYLHASTSHWLGTSTRGYGREISREYSRGLLLLQLDYPDADKKELLINLVQHGIDIYGVARAGREWVNDGGHNGGRKMPMLLAGTVLNNPDILLYADAQKHLIFQEDQQTFFVTQSDVDREHRSVWASRGVVPEEYTQGDLGLAEWGMKHHTSPTFDDKNWGAPYRTVCGSSAIGHILAARIMGLTGEWNHPAAFAYQDRFWEMEQSNRQNSTNHIELFEAAMWDAYRDL